MTPTWDSQKLTPKQFEDKVHHWLRRGLTRDGIRSFTMASQGVVTGDGGDYSIDSLVTIN
jgi:hypothetical protein